MTEKRAGAGQPAGTVEERPPLTDYSLGRLQDQKGKQAGRKTKVEA